MARFISAPGRRVEINTEMICSIHLSVENDVETLVIYLAGNVKEEFIGEDAISLEKQLKKLYGGFDSVAVPPVS